MRRRTHRRQPLLVRTWLGRLTRLALCRRVSGQEIVCDMRALIGLAGSPRTLITFDPSPQALADAWDHLLTVGEG